MNASFKNDLLVSSQNQNDMDERFLPDSSLLHEKKNLAREGGCGRSKSPVMVDVRSK